MVDNMDTVDNVNTVDIIDIVIMQKTSGYLNIEVATGHFWMENLTWWTW